MSHEYSKSNQIVFASDDEGKEDICSVELAVGPLFIGLKKTLTMN